MESVIEYIDLLFDKLNELVIEDIRYSDYDQMTDWLFEIKNWVRKMEKVEMTRVSAIRPRSNYGEYTCICGKLVEHLCDSCSGCGQKLDWTDEED